MTKVGVKVAARDSGCGGGERAGHTEALGDLFLGQVITLPYLYVNLPS